MPAAVEPAPRSPLSLETEGTIFFSLVSSAIFFWFGAIYYEDTFVSDATGGILAAYPWSNYALVLGTIGLGAVYLALAVACWRRPSSSRFYLMTAVLSAVLAIAFFILRYQNASVYRVPASAIYIDFLQGDNVLSGFIELILFFLSFRAYRQNRPRREMPQEEEEESVPIGAEVDAAG